MAADAGRGGVVTRWAPPRLTLDADDRAALRRALPYLLAVLVGSVGLCWLGVVLGVAVLLFRLIVGWGG